MKKCPKCAEDVQDEAVVCRYCGHPFTKNETRRQSAENRNSLQSCAGCLLPIILGTVIALTVFYFFIRG